MTKILKALDEAFKEILSPFIFFAITFNLLAVIRALLLQQYGIVTRSSAVATIGALVVAKIVFLTDKIPFLNLYPKKPLIATILLKAVAFSVVTFFYMFVEEFIHLWTKYHSFGGVWTNYSSEVIWPAFWVREIWLFVMLLFYCESVEVIRVFGKDKMKAIFFGAKGPKA